MQIDRQEFIKELTFLSTSCEKKPTVEVLKYFLFETNNGVAHFRTSNLDLTADTSMEVETSENISICLPLFETLAAVKNMRDDFISLTFENGRAWLKDKKSKFKLPTMSADKFPQIESAKEDYKFSISSKLLQKLINLTSFACTGMNDHNKYQTRSIYLKFADKKLSAWGLDGNFLSYLEFTGEFNQADKDLSFPNYFSKPCLSLCETADEIEIISETNYLKASAGKRSILTRLLMNGSPKIQMIRFQNDVSFSVKQSEMKRAINNIKSFDDLKGGYARINFANKDNELHAFSRSSEFDTETFLECENLKEFNAFILDGSRFDKFLTALGNEKFNVILRPSSVGKATTLQAVYECDELRMEFYQQTLNF